MSVTLTLSWYAFPILLLKVRLGDWQHRTEICQKCRISGPNLRPTESESTFSQDSRMIHVHIEVWKTLGYPPPNYIHVQPRNPPRSLCPTSPPPQRHALPLHRSFLLVLGLERRGWFRWPRNAWVTRRPPRPPTVFPTIQLYLSLGNH